MLIIRVISSILILCTRCHRTTFYKHMVFTSTLMSCKKKLNGLPPHLDVKKKRLLIFEQNEENLRYKDYKYSLNYSNKEFRIFTFFTTYSQHLSYKN